MAKTRKSDVRYGEAVEEIEKILLSIDRDEIDIDDLSTKVARAAELIRLCQSKLRETEMKVTQVLAGLEAEAGGESAEERDEAEEDAEGEEPADPEGPDDLPF